MASSGNSKRMVNIRPGYMPILALSDLIQQPKVGLSRAVNRLNLLWQLPVVLTAMRTIYMRAN